MTISARTSGSSRLLSRGSPPNSGGTLHAHGAGILPPFELRLDHALLPQPGPELLHHPPLLVLELPDGVLDLFVLVERVPCLLVGHRRRRLCVLSDVPLAPGFRRRPRQADRQEEAGPAVPTRCGEVPVRQRVEVRPVEHEVSDQLSEPLRGPFQGLSQPLRGDDLVVPLAAAGVHRGDHRVPQLSESPQGVEGCLGHRRRPSPQETR